MEDYSNFYEYYIVMILSHTVKDVKTICRFSSSAAGRLPPFLTVTQANWETGIFVRPPARCSHNILYRKQGVSPPMTCS